ncbi:interferon lambda receptor 1 isoform X1 [Symphalangus syndactylus]|uniref:interferon lambda receptor 1 isoform X1 n=1 Tax=Symphalangus syndactylus TaxID=9590 RepID=UPI002442AD6F|nr:interferon lambda receptor 1 isoform X1 [Symphalangus syndactylus]
MAGPERWGPLLLCLLQAAPGRPRLAPPQNVTLLSQNFSVYLTWLPGLGNPQDVTYFVAYQSSPTHRRWREVEECAGTKELLCSMMCLKKQDLYNKFKGRVRTVSPSSRSPWVESEYLDYLFEVEPAPPVLVLTQTEEILRANATYQLPPCMPPLDLKYEVAFWKEGAGNKTLFPVTPHGQPVQITLQPAASEHHCLSARTIYTFSVPKYSKFSKPTCFLLEVPEANWAFLVLPSLLILLLVIAAGGVIWKSLMGNPWFQRAKMPRALDFSGHTHPVATFQPSRPESVNDLFLCPQKELTRGVRPTPRVRAPATQQAGWKKDLAEDEEEDEDEEDTEDGVRFQPYIQPPSFLGQEHQVPGHSEAGGVDSGRPRASLVPSEGSSAWDSSDRSWASTVDSSWDRAGSSDYLAEKGPGQGSDGDRHQESLPPPEFSKDSGFLEEPSKDDLSSWATWGTLPPETNLVPGGPLVSLRTLTFCWESSPEEEEEEEEARESETEDSDVGSWGAESTQRTEERGRTLGHYMAR